MQNRRRSGHNPTDTSWSMGRRPDSRYRKVCLSDIREHMQTVRCSMSLKAYRRRRRWRVFCRWRSRGWRGTLLACIGRKLSRSGEGPWCVKLSCGSGGSECTNSSSTSSRRAPDTAPTSCQSLLLGPQSSILCYSNA